MANRYSVVVRTYLGPPLAGVLWLFCSVVSYAAVFDPSLSFIPFIAIYVGIACFAWSVGIHVKEQFANPRSALLPGFRSPHLFVAAIISSIGLLSATTVICRFAGSSFLGTAAILVTIYTVVLWAAFRPSPLGAVAVVFLLALILSSPYWYPFLIEGKADNSDVLILASCGVLLVILGVRLILLDEDMPEYRMLVPSGLSVARAERRFWYSWQGHWQLEWRPWLFARGIPAAHGGCWGRVLLWRVGLSPFNMATMMPLLFLPAWLVPAMLIGLEPAVNSLLWMPALFSGTFLGCLTAMMWIQRWPRLGYELLYPTNRRDFCRQIGLAFGLEVFEGWVWTVLSVGCIVAAVRPVLLRGPDIAVFLALNAIIPLAQWATATLLTSYSQSRMLMLVVGLFVSLPPAFVWLAYLVSPTPYTVETYLTIALGVVLLSIGMLYLAYRRWLRLDLP